VLLTKKKSKAGEGNPNYVSRRGEMRRKAGWLRGPNFGRSQGKKKKMGLGGILKFKTAKGHGLNSAGGGATRPMKGEKKIFLPGRERQKKG